MNNLYSIEDYVWAAAPPPSSRNSFQDHGGMKSIPREEGPETPSQKTLSESIADSELTHYSRNEQCLASANL